MRTEREARSADEAIIHFFRCEATFICFLKYFLLVLTFPVTFYILFVFSAIKYLIRDHRSNCCKIIIFTVVVLPFVLVFAAFKLIGVPIALLLCLLNLLCDRRSPSRLFKEKYLGYFTDDLYKNAALHNAERARQAMD